MEDKLSDEFLAIVNHALLPTGRFRLPCPTSRNLCSCPYAMRKPVNKSTFQKKKSLMGKTLAQKQEKDATNNHHTTILEEQAKIQTAQTRAETSTQTGRYRTARRPSTPISVVSLWLLAIVHALLRVVALLWVPALLWIVALLAVVVALIALLAVVVL